MEISHGAGITQSSPCLSKPTPQMSSLRLPGNLLEVQDVTPYPGSTELESALF